MDSPHKYATCVYEAIRCFRDPVIRQWQTTEPFPNLRPRVILGSDASCKGTVRVPFKMLRERIPMLSAMTLDQLGAKMRCDKCGKRPERYYPAKQDDTPGFVRSF
jgi:hypothetical protein